jgi:hypothetical protein
MLWSAGVLSNHNDSSTDLSTDNKWEQKDDLAIVAKLIGLIKILQ